VQYVTRLSPAEVLAAIDSHLGSGRASTLSKN
jgi:hypothetical protein